MGTAGQDTLNLRIHRIDVVRVLCVFRARYYDPTTGRFLSEDPLGFAGGDCNLYAYVFDDPANLNDPNGEIAPLVAACLGGAASTQASN